jgi:Fe2+ transport system protein B
LKDRIADALDPWLRRCGLSGRDLVPLLGGYGCNVVAVLQSRASSHCTRGACVSQIALGSACSYQLGATLAVFSAAALPALFVPYLLLLLVVGGLHTRLWYGSRTAARLPLVQTTYLQWPALRVVCWRSATQLRQFITQALPAFTLICLIAAALDHWGFLSVLSTLVHPLGNALGLDERAIGAVALSLVRKDGLLLLIPSAAQPAAAVSLLLAVWLGSTLSACSVTLWTIARELGVAHAWRITYRQALTALGSSLFLASFLSSASRP